MRPILLCRNSIRIVAIVFAMLFAASAALGQTSSFTYQGRLTDGGTAANGNYDVQFALFDSLSGGTQIGSTQTLNTVAVTGGVFTVTLDFGANSFSGANRFLEISARPSGTGSFTLLTPRQPVTATPYAERSANAGAADALSSACSSCVQDSQISSVSGNKVSGTVASATNATNATTATNATQLGGIAPSQYVQTNDSRLSDARPPTPGSSNYIQTNPSSAQSASFNISGNGTVGGALSGNVVNAADHFNLNNQPVMSVSGCASSPNGNTFVGIGAGTSNTLCDGTINTFFGNLAGNKNTTGRSNSFFGFNAGSNNTTGIFNAFFGQGAGSNNTDGLANSMFGSSAGTANTGSANTFMGEEAGPHNTSGSNNSFFGRFAGNNNTVGSSNTALGFQVSFGSNNLTNATAIGACSRVTQSNSLILGSTNSSPACAVQSDTNVGIGITAPVFRLHVVDPGAAGLRVQTNTGGGAVASFGGNGDFQVDSNGTTGGRFVVQQGGNVGIGTAAPDNKLTVNGTADKPGGGSWGTFSDERLKNIKGRFTPGLRAVMRFQPLRYEYKRDNALGIKSEGEHVGFSAQAVQKIIPEAVTTNDKGYLLVNNDPILWTMLNAIKEQQAQIAKQQAQLSKQQTEIDVLKRRLAQSRQRVARH